MATIERRARRDGTPRYRVKVRVHGAPPHTATFPRLVEARRWAHMTEAAVRAQRQCPPLEAARHTVEELLVRYRRTVLAHKSPGTARTQASKLAWWQAQLGALRLADVTPARLVAARE